jgi:hypothetical protein
MANEPNFNEIAASVIQGQINNAIAAVSKGLRGAVTRVLGVINKDLTKYTAAKIKKCSYVRTPIINRDRSTYIYDIYVQTRLKIKGRVVGDDDFIAQLRENDSVVIAGNAGSGKSMLMRRQFRETTKFATPSSVGVRSERLSGKSQIHPPIEIIKFAREAEWRCRGSLAFLI